MTDKIETVGNDLGTCLSEPRDRIILQEQSSETRGRGSNAKGQQQRRPSRSSERGHSRPHDGWGEARSSRPNPKAALQSEKTTGFMSRDLPEGSARDTLITKENNRGRCPTLVESGDWSGLRGADASFGESAIYATPKILHSDTAHLILELYEDMSSKRIETASRQEIQSMKMEDDERELEQICKKLQSLVQHKQQWFSAAELETQPTYQTLEDDEHASNPEEDAALSNLQHMRTLRVTDELRALENSKLGKMVFNTNEKIFSPFVNLRSQVDDRTLLTLPNSSLTPYPEPWMRKYSWELADKRSPLGSRSDARPGPNLEVTDYDMPAGSATGADIATVTPSRSEPGVNTRAALGYPNNHSLSKTLPRYYYFPKAWRLHQSRKEQARAANLGFGQSSASAKFPMDTLGASRREHGYVQHSLAAPAAEGLTSPRNAPGRGSHNDGPTRYASQPTTFATGLDFGFPFQMEGDIRWTGATKPWTSRSGATATDAEYPAISNARATEAGTRDASFTKAEDARTTETSSIISQRPRKRSKTFEYTSKTQNKGISSTVLEPGFTGPEEGELEASTSTSTSTTQDVKSSPERPWSNPSNSDAPTYCFKGQLLKKNTPLNEQVVPDNMAKRQSKKTSRGGKNKKKAPKQNKKVSFDIPEDSTPSDASPSPEDRRPEDRSTEDSSDSGVFEADSFFPATAFFRGRRSRTERDDGDDDKDDVDQGQGKGEGKEHRQKPKLKMAAEIDVFYENHGRFRGPFLRGILKFLHAVSQIIYVLAQIMSVSRPALDPNSALWVRGRQGKCDERDVAVIVIAFCSLAVASLLAAGCLRVLSFRVVYALRALGYYSCSLEEVGEIAAMRYTMVPRYARAYDELRLLREPTP
ncbi:hypothetical protein F4808DRAFT_455014 [Astrocystis sublimbata]|nr:hypothetical protein F4808DRAFT_455014 [Astrocystis sublimbata]